MGPHAGQLGMIWGSCGSFQGPLRSHLGVSRELSRASSELSWSRLGVLWELPGRQSVTVRRGRQNRQGKRGRSLASQASQAIQARQSRQAGQASYLAGWAFLPACPQPCLQPSLQQRPRSANHHQSSACSGQRPPVSSLCMGAGGRRPKALYRYTYVHTYIA